MRLYSFTNMYTSGIHAGIQTAHVIHEMMRKYEKKNEGPHMDLRVAEKLSTLYTWADQHKTIIVKSAGYHQHLVDLYSELKEYSGFFHLPLGRWRESKDALNNAQTAVAIVVPKFIYDFQDPRTPMYPEQKFPDEASHMAHGLNQIINRYRMAT